MWRTRDNVYCNVHHQLYRRRKFNAVFRRGDTSCYCICKLKLASIRSLQICIGLDLFSSTTKCLKHIWCIYACDMNLNPDTIASIDQLLSIDLFLYLFKDSHSTQIYTDSVYSHFSVRRHSAGFYFLDHIP